MDTPEKDQIGFPLSKFEDSPVFNYINSLSPINPVTSNTAQIITPLSFASPQSVFASPNISSLKESRFLRRHHLSDLSKPEFSHIRNEDCAKERIPDVVQLSDLCSKLLGCLSPEKSSGACTNEPLHENLKLANESPKHLKNDSGRPESNVVDCDAVNTDTMPDMIGTPAALVHFVQDLLNKRCHPCENEADLPGIGQTEQNKETSQCNWENLISNAANMLIDESVMEKQTEGQDQNTIDSGELAFISTILELPQDDMTDLKTPQSVNSVGSAQQEMDVPVTQSGSQELKETHRAPKVHSSTLICRLVGNDPSPEVDDNGGDCKNQHSIRRRCLVYETVGAHRKQALHYPNSSSMILSQSNCEMASNRKQLASFKPRNNYLTTILPGIGLHLNALASSSNIGKDVNHETHASEKKPTYMPNSSSFNCSASAQKLQDQSLTLESVEGDFPNENKIQVKDDASMTSTMGGGEEFNHSSPKRKRQRFEDDGGSEACKRCNCKKSKCLKLYCECFAAGLYCIEPCSCQDCFNKPIHEDTVLETRRQIESRNPLAFAPKVIRNTDSVPEYGDDDSNKTPASARHKRGCNCKKSSCLKKYCECFQGGVGCSISCRCEGCKNAFGRKDGVDETEIEGGDTEGCETNELEISSQNIAVHKVEEGNPEVVIPTPSFESGRASPQLPFSFCGKSLQFSAFSVGSALQLSTNQEVGTSRVQSSRPNLEKHLQVIPGQGTPEILTDNSLPATPVKSISPSCKRVQLPHGKLGSSAWRSRKLILRSIPSFPSITSRQVTSDLPAKQH